ncbi:hypothetical protein HDU96_007324, partial [Phlyctochytrium bullatum]
LHDAFRFFGDSNFGPPGSNNPDFDYTGLVDRTWCPGDGYVATVNGFPMCVAMIGRIIDSKGGVAKLGGRYSQISIDAQRGYGSFNERVSVCLQLCMSRDDMVKLIRSIAVGTRFPARMREYDVGPDSTLFTRTKACEGFEY